MYLTKLTIIFNVEYRVSIRMWDIGELELIWKIYWIKVFNIYIQDKSQSDIPQLNNRNIDYGGARL